MTMLGLCKAVFDAPSRFRKKEQLGYPKFEFLLLQ